MAQTVIGFFDNTTEAQEAMRRLISAGFRHDDVDISAQSATGSAGTSRDSRREDEDTGDSISRFFKSLFDSDDDVNSYSEVARRSGSIVTVHAQSGEQAERAADILDDSGAVDVDERAAQYGYAGNTGTRTDTTTTEGTTSVPVIEEELHVGKREVETGGARLRSRIIERPVEQSLRLREEHVRVERNPVNRPATEADLNTFREGTIEVVEHAEVPIVDKEARVVEEITLDKDVDERVETVRDTVRSTEVDVEKIGTDGRPRTTTDLDDDSLNTRRDL